MREISIPSLWFAVVLNFAGAAVQAATDPALPGPFSTGRISVDVPVEGGATRSTYVYYPALGGGVDPAAGRCPVVAFGHGFNRDRDRYTDLGTHLASRGFVVLIANYVCGIFSGCDHSRNADEMSDVIDWILARDFDPSSIFFGRIATTRIGTSGHSAGGLQSLVCASRDVRVGASAPMDPVDSNGLGVGSLPGAILPIAITWSEPSSCNADASAEDLFQAANPQKRGVKLVGANHCDPEKDNDFFGCALTCGAWNATRHQRYLRYVTGWFEYYLHCDSSYKDWVAGSRVESDLAGGVITYAAALNPEPPIGLTAVRDGGSVDVAREPPSRCVGVDFWRLYRSETPGGPRSLVADSLPVSQLLWTDGSANPGSSYFYVARDVFSDFLGGYESADSNEARVDASPTAPQEASPVGAPLLATRAAGTTIQLHYTPGACATDHVVYWGAATGPLSGQPSWTDQACGLGASGSASFDPGDPPDGAWKYFVIVGNNGAAEGSYGLDSSGSERPEATGLPSCDIPQQLSGTCP